MKQHFPSFKIASGEPQGVELSVEVNSSDQQLMEQDDAINNGSNIGSAEQSNIAGTNSGEKSTIETSKRKPEITHEDLERHFGKKFDDVAQIFNVSRPTLKRICREHKISQWPRPQRKIDNVNDSLFMSDLSCSDLSREVLEQKFGRNFGDVEKSFNGRESGIPNWPHLKIDKVNYSFSNMEPACSDMPRGQAMATAAHMMPHVTTMQDVKTVDIKAEYKGGTLIRFKLPPTAGMVKLEEEIVKRLTFLQVGCFKVTYLDEENDSILLACDTDLQNYINTSIASGITKIRMFIEPETNRQP
ncbi:hypothetical protein F0562_025833 [Nyssa sinensis]|uniref:PB1 domain-containing protein n=1 Tax=Nyssa sinensis TaxID=561372 RepID=A0A5J5BD55_9ASTE|nr:hypothetical protein F0562_025833 [Nyssa sinensis]